MIEFSFFFLQFFVSSCNVFSMLVLQYVVCSWRKKVKIYAGSGMISVVDPWVQQPYKVTVQSYLLISLLLWRTHPRKLIRRNEYICLNNHECECEEDILIFVELEASRNGKSSENFVFIILRLICCSLFGMLPMILNLHCWRYIERKLYCSDYVGVHLNIIL